MVLYYALLLPHGYLINCDHGGRIRCCVKVKIPVEYRCTLYTRREFRIRRATRLKGPAVSIQSSQFQRLI